MYIHKSKPARIHSIFLAIFVAMLIFNISTSLASDSYVDDTTTSIDPSFVTTTDADTLVTNFSAFYDSIVNDDTIRTSTIMLNGTVNDMIELRSDSTAVILPGPDGQIGLKYNDATSICPPGSTICSYNDDSVISMPQDALSADRATVFKVSEIVVLPIENFAATASFDQSIDKLDTYKVKIVFNELDNPVLSDNTRSYSADWGDGSIEDYTTDEITASHVYSKSGTYLQTFTITDDFGFTYTIQQTYTVDYEGPLLHTYFILEDNKEPVAVTTSTGLSALAIGLIAFTETGKYKFLALLPLLIPMYTYIQKEDVLDQFVRGQIYGYIKTNPGVHYNQIRRGIDIKNGTLSYHLRVLEKTELIKSRREGLKYRAFYPTGMRFPKEERFRLTDLQISILDIIKENNGTNQKEIAKKLEQKPQTINYNIKVLEQAGLIEVIKKGRRTSCYPKEDVFSDQPAE